MYFLSKSSIGFPPVEFAEADGCLALGGDLRPERLLLAYKSGIFPWYSDESRISYQGSKILWWSPDPRFVLFPDKIHISKSMKKVLAKKEYTVTVNTAFPQVISRCRHEVRVHQEGTWITDEMEKAYNRLYSIGYAVSVESWLTGTDILAGGLYGVMIGKAFFGESMFSTYPNASKAAFITFVEKLSKIGCPVIDCQVETEHLRSLGGEFIPRIDFLKLIKEAVSCEQADFF